MTYVSSRDHLPKVPHLGVLVFSSVYIEGDERSRTNPGHGYPGGCESQVNYIAFNTEAEAADWIERNQEKHFSVIHTTPKAVKTKLQVSLQ